MSNQFNNTDSDSIILSKDDIQKYHDKIARIEREKLIELDPVKLGVIVAKLEWFQNHLALKIPYENTISVGLIYFNESFFTIGD
ncbi:MAG: hypothetical protein WCO65_03500 [bacterium]